MKRMKGFSGAFCQGEGCCCQHERFRLALRGSPVPTLGLPAATGGSCAGRPRQQVARLNAMVVPLLDVGLAC